MKVWWVFAWDKYYPLGELDNLVATFHTQEEAEAYAKYMRADAYESYDHITVIDVRSMLFDEE
jgi:hypothetical protein